MMDPSQRARDNLTLLDRVWRGRQSGRLELRVGGREERLAVISGGVYPGPDGLVGLRAAAARGLLRFRVARGEPVAQPGSRAGLAAVILELAELLADRESRPVAADALVRLRVDADLAYEIMSPHLADRLGRKAVAAGALLRDGSVGGRQLRALQLLRLVRIDEAIDEVQPVPGRDARVEQAPPPVRRRAPSQPVASDLVANAAANVAADVAAADSFAEETGASGAQDAGVSWRVDRTAYDDDDPGVFACEADDDFDSDDGQPGAGELDEYDSGVYDSILASSELSAERRFEDPAADIWALPGDGASDDGAAADRAGDDSASSTSIDSPLFQDEDIAHPGAADEDAAEEDAADEDDGDMDSAVLVLEPHDDDGSGVFACEDDDDDPSSSVFSMSAELLNSMLSSADDIDDDAPWTPPVREDPDVEIEDDDGDSWLDSGIDDAVRSTQDSALQSSSASALDSSVESHSSWTDARPWSPTAGFWAADAAGGDALVFEAEGGDDDTTCGEAPFMSEDVADDVTEPESEAPSARLFGDRTIEDFDEGLLDLEETVPDALSDDDLVTDEYALEEDTAESAPVLVADDQLISGPILSDALPGELSGEIKPADLRAAEGFVAELQAELLNRARSELRSGAYEEAGATLDRCDALHPDDPAVRVHRAWARLLAGEQFFARFEAEAAVAMAPGDPLVRDLALALVERTEG